jgi:hypothetical protein
METKSGRSADGWKGDGTATENATMDIKIQKRGRENRKMGMTKLS